jgi:hypothetical protein
VDQCGAQGGWSTVDQLTPALSPSSYGNNATLLAFWLLHTLKSALNDFLRKLHIDVLRNL